MPAESESRVVFIRDAHIELAQLLKFAGLAETGGEAKQVIAAGQVLVNGSTETQRGKKIVPGDRVSYNGHTLIVRGS